MDLAEALRTIGPQTGVSAESDALRQEAAGVVYAAAMKIGEKLSKSSEFRERLGSDGEVSWKDVVTKIIVQWIEAGFEWARKNPIENAEAVLRKQIRWRMQSAAKKQDEMLARSSKQFGVTADENTEAPEIFQDIPVTDEDEKRLAEIIELIKGRAPNSTVGWAFEVLRRIKDREVEVKDVLAEENITRAAFDQRTSRAIRRVRKQIMETEEGEQKTKLLYLLGTYKIRGGL